MSSLFSWNILLIVCVQKHFNEELDGKLFPMVLHSYALPEVKFHIWSGLESQYSMPSENSLAVPWSHSRHVSSSSNHSTLLGVSWKHRFSIFWSFTLCLKNAVCGTALENTLLISEDWKFRVDIVKPILIGQNLRLANCHIFVSSSLQDGGRISWNRLGTPHRAKAR